MSRLTKGRGRAEWRKTSNGWPRTERKSRSTKLEKGRTECGKTQCSGWPKTDRKEERHQGVVGRGQNERKKDTTRTEWNEERSWTVG